MVAFFSTLHPKIWVIEQIGEKQIIEQIGRRRFVKQIGKKEVLEELGVDDILANLSPAKRRELQRRLQAEQRRRP